jgi:hypothetical protein
MSEGFDLAAHQRNRIRRLERDLAGVTRHRDRLERLLALAVTVAAGDDCEPLVLLRMLELLLDADGDAGRSELSVDETVELLRRTDPARSGAQEEVRVAA